MVVAHPRVQLGEHTCPPALFTNACTMYVLYGIVCIVSTIVCVVLCSIVHTCPPALFTNASLV